MTRKQFNVCLAEAANYSDKYAYIGDMCLSSIWEDDESVDPMDYHDDVLMVWEAAHRNMKDIVAATSGSLTVIANKFNIPYDTAQKWYSGTREPAAYILMMLQELLGLLPEIE